jgi:hypothetical protein
MVYRVRWVQGFCMRFVILCVRERETREKARTRERARERESDFIKNDTPYRGDPERRPVTSCYYSEVSSGEYW